MEQLGKYQLIKKLAIGGMAEVFLARAAGPMGFSKTVVVKRILPHLAEDTSFAQMFLTEARIAAELNHPNIVQIFDFGEDSGTWFIAMEFIDGANLRELVRRGSKAGAAVPFALAARIISQACEGLAFAHDSVDPQTGQPLHLIHRDISPDNIMVSRSGAVKVVDFGVAKAALRGRAETRSGVVKGKLAYMAPEQLANEALDRRADVYSLGIVLFELLSGGEPPFNDTSEAMIIQSILSADPLYPITRFRRDAPMMIERIIAKAMDKDPSRRYANCKAFQADLERFIVSLGEPVQGSSLADLVRRLAGPSQVPEPTPMTVPLGDSEDNRTTAPVRPAPPRPSPSLPKGAPAAPPPPKGSLAAAQSKGAPAALPREYDAADSDPLAETQLDPRIAARRARALSNPARTTDAGSPPGDDDGFDPALDQTEMSSGPTLTVRAPVGRSGRRAVVFGALAAALLVAGVALLVLRSHGASDPTPPTGTAAVAPPTAAPPSPSSGAQDPSATAPTPGTEAPLREVTVSPMPAGSKAVALEIRVIPYAQVYLDQTYVGETPFAPINTTAGKHFVRLVNPRLKKDLTLEVLVKAGEENVLKYNFLKEE